MTILNKLKAINASDDPAKLHYTFAIVEIGATDTKPAHDIIQGEYSWCKQSKAWVSWGRLRAHLSADGLKVLAAGVTCCPAAPPSIKAKFSQIVEANMATSTAPGSNCPG